MRIRLNFNTDGCWKSTTSLAGVGGLVHDSQGKWL